MSSPPEEGPKGLVLLQISPSMPSIYSGPSLGLFDINRDFREVRSEFTALTASATATPTSSIKFTALITTEAQLIWREGRREEVVRRGGVRQQLPGGCERDFHPLRTWASILKTYTYMTSTQYDHCTHEPSYRASRPPRWTINYFTTIQNHNTNPHLLYRLHSSAHNRNPIQPLTRASRETSNRPVHRFSTAVKLKSVRSTVISVAGITSAAPKALPHLLMSITGDAGDGVTQWSSMPFGPLAPLGRNARP